MAKYTMDMVLEYAKVFPENADMGNPEGNRISQAIYEKGGQYIVNAYFTSQDQIDQLLAEGLQEEILGNPRILDGNAELGIGKYVKMKRLINNVISFTDKKTGKSKEVDYGGAPVIVDLTKGMDKKRPWSFEEDGELGNGTEAKINFETYSNGAGIRLIAVGVTKHKVWEKQELDDSEDWMKVA